VLSISRHDELKIIKSRSRGKLEPYLTIFERIFPEGREKKWMNDVREV
jgi:hypothetical protein